LSNQLHLPFEQLYGCPSTGILDWLVVNYDAIGVPQASCKLFEMPMKIH